MPAPASFQKTLKQQWVQDITSSASRNFLGLSRNFLGFILHITSGYLPNSSSICFFLGFYFWDQRNAMALAWDGTAPATISHGYGMIWFD